MIVVIVLVVAILPFLGMTMLRQRKSLPNRINDQGTYDEYPNGKKQNALNCGILLIVCLAISGWLLASKNNSLIGQGEVKFVTPGSKHRCQAPFASALVGAYSTIDKLPSDNVSVATWPMFEKIVDTMDSVAVALFTQGIVQLYGFNREEARRNFEACEIVDAFCVYCIWG